MQDSMQNPAQTLATYQATTVSSPTLFAQGAVVCNGFVQVPTAVPIQIIPAHHHPPVNRELSGNMQTYKSSNLMELASTGPVRDLSSFDTPFLANSPLHRGKYLRSTYIGHGQFAETCIATSRETGMRVAAKITDRRRLPEEHIQFVRRELDCLRACDHPNVMKLLDYYEDENQCIAILELCDAGDLHDQVHSNNVRFNEEQVGIILVQLLLGVHHIHQHRMIHRDIKTSNLMLTTSGYLKIGDFGFSRIYDTSVSNNVANTYLGTPYYLSPERWQRRPYSKKADIWSVGVSAYELAAGGRRPFSGHSREEIQKHATTSEPEPISGVSDEMMRIIFWMLAKDPDQRPSAFQVLQHRLLRRALIRFVQSVVHDDSFRKDPHINDGHRQFMERTRKAALKAVEELEREFHQAGVPADREIVLRHAQETERQSISLEEYPSQERVRALTGEIKLRSGSSSAGFVWKDRVLTISEDEICVSLPASKAAAQGSARSQTVALSEVLTVSLTTHPSSDGPSFVISIKLNKGIVVLGCKNQEDCDRWIQHFQSVLNFAKQQLVLPC